ncbi:MAG TPA: PilZ domain-containing protein [Pyrinomonadaceae bacterium]|nr:PilZ domain-containing protein [Pyrinomonadaceae bacterium]
MPELVRSITARIRQFIRDRRCGKRYAVRLSCQVEFAKANVKTNGRHPAPSIEGHTRDISSDGVALILPAIRIGDRYLAGENHALLVRLRLPSQTVEMHTVAVRYDTFTDGDEGTGYIIGTRITKLGQEDRAQYVEYLAQLAQK